MPVSPQHRTSPRTSATRIRVIGTLHHGALLVSQAEMNSNDTYTDVTLSGMM